MVVLSTQHYDVNKKGSCPNFLVISRPNKMAVGQLSPPVTLDLHNCNLTSVKHAVDNLPLLVWEHGTGFAHLEFKTIG